jgi:hypothetical protein
MFSPNEKDCFRSVTDSLPDCSIPCLRYDPALPRLSLGSPNIIIPTPQDIHPDAIPLPYFYGNLSICHFNLRDINSANKFEDLNLEVKRSPYYYDVIGVSESWCNKYNGSSFQLPNYQCIANSRSTRGGGGCLLYIAEHLRVEKIAKYTCDEERTQGIMALIGFEEFVMAVGVCYSANGSVTDIEEVITGLERDVAGQLDIKNGILMGDFNVDLLKYNDSKTSDFLSMMSSKGYLPTIDIVTRVSSGSCIDNIYISGSQNCLEILPGVLDVYISDHFPVFLVINQTLISNAPADGSSTHRVFDKEGHSSFREKLMEEDWSIISTIEGVDNMIGYFYDRLFGLYDTSFRIVNHIKKKGKPISKNSETLLDWYDNDLLQMRNQIDKMRASKSKHTLDQAGCFRLNTLKKDYKRKIKEKQANYYVKLFSDCTDISDTWKLINNLCDRSKKLIRPTKLKDDNGTCLTTDEEIAESFNDYFANIGRKTTLKLAGGPDSNLVCESLTMYGSNAPKFMLSEVDLYEIWKTLRSMKVNMTDSINSVPSAIIKQYGEFLTLPLGIIVNSSISTGVFPTVLKEGIILPIYKKKGSTNLLENYRPITTTKMLAKLIEKIVKRQLDDYLTKLDYFGREQFGFSVGLNTELALGNMMKQVHDITDAGDLAVAIFVDVEKAFDCVSHEVLIDMLEKLQFDNSALKWFSSYLKDRKISTRIGDTLSQKLNINLGCPQGTVISPKLFNILINPLLRITQLLRAFAFADDSTFIGRLRLKLLHSDVYDINQQLKVIADWYRITGLSINAEKSRAIIFRTDKCKAKVDDIEIVLDGKLVNIVKKHLCLGVVLDQHLKWYPHINHITTKCYGALNALNVLNKKGVGQSVLIMAYKAIFLPQLTYCMAIWGGCGMGVLHRLSVLQNRAIRCIFGLDFRESTSSYLRENKLLNVDQLVYFHTAIFSFNNFNNLLLRKINFGYSLPNVTNKRFDFPFLLPINRLALTDTSVYFRVAKLWLDLDPSIRNTVNITLFKSRLLHKILS